MFPAAANNPTFICQTVWKQAEEEGESEEEEEEYQQW